MNQGCSVGDRGVLDDLLTSDPLDESGLAAFLYKDSRAKGIVRHLIFKKNSGFNDFDEAFQQSIFAFFEESKKHNKRLLDRMDGSAEGFYRLWWGVCQNVILDMMREARREDRFESDEHEDAVIQAASIHGIRYNGSFEEKVESQLVFQRFNFLLSSEPSLKAQSIIDKVMNAKKSDKQRGRPSKKNENTESLLPFASEAFSEASRNHAAPSQNADATKSILPFADGHISGQSEVGALDAYGGKKSKTDPGANKDVEEQAARLSTIRKLLGLSIAKYADEIGIPEYRLISYLYTRVQKIPDDVVSRAESLFSVGKNTALSTASIADMTMTRILQIWRSQIGGTNEDVEKRLGLSSSTIPRWEQGVTRPSIRRIKDYCRIIDKSISKK